MRRKLITHGIAVMGIAVFALLTIACGSTQAAGSSSRITYWDEAKMAFEGGDYDQAIEFATEDLRLNPGHNGMYELRGDAHVKKGEYARAIADYEMCLRLSPYPSKITEDRLTRARELAARQGTSPSAAQSAPQQVLAQANTGTGSAPVVPGTVVWNGKEVTWVEAVNGIRNGGNNKKHSIVISGTVPIPLTPDSENTFGVVTGIEVSIEGDGILTRSGGAGGILMRIGNSQTITLRDITLRGDGIASRGILRIEGNALVTGNTSSGIQGRGLVYISGGSFFIQDNAVVSGTNARGVYIDSNAVFTMNSGAITGNSAKEDAPQKDYGGGGVYIAQNGTFIMRGGTISGNSIPSDGGGVKVLGTFIMEGGTISGNTGHFGGGVYVEQFGGIFTMKGGTILGNTAKNGNGGGVYIPGTFIMEGGTISGNSASRNGGGVYAIRVGTSTEGNFTKTGGTIHGGDEPDARLRNSASNRKGHAVATSMNNWRNATAGPDVKSDSYGFWLNEQ